jgi:hypothetical protein
MFVFLLFVFAFVFFSACQDEQPMTEQQAIEIVRNQFEDTQFGPIEIISVQRKGGYYEIIWTRDSNCEGGTMKVNVKTGETEGRHHIC